MVFKPTDIPDVLINQPAVLGDGRGLFKGTFYSVAFAGVGIAEPFVQDNHSRSQPGILRDLRYQIRHPQGKLARTVRAETFDITVDPRRNSSAFSRWVRRVAFRKKQTAIMGTDGFCKEFLSFSEWAEVNYKVTDYYAPEREGALLWNDPAIGIEWPL